MFDLIMVVTLVHLVPHLWVAAMGLGLMVALAPSVSLHPASHWIYLAFGVVLLSGLTFAAIVHDVVGWELPMAAVAVTYPSMLYYTYTQMRRANELRERAQLMRGMTELAGSVAHDFNNMLTTIIGHAELAQMKLSASQEAREDINHILSGADRAALLCRQLLSFAGRNVGRPGQVDLKAEIQTMAGLLAPVMPAGVAIEVDAPEFPVYLSADVSQVQQVLMNVLLNAGDAMIGMRGSISVTLCRATEEPANCVELTVSDSGHGIPESVITKIFDPLFSTKGEGHGLGLASTKKIMDDLGGSISVDSQVSGTKVTLRWNETKAPASTAQESGDATAGRDTASDAGRLVLVVDDDASVREVAAGLLARLGYDVMEASDAFEAEAAFERDAGKFYAVLLDLKMPVKDGWSCLRDLRKISSQTPIVICSGYDPQESLPAFAQEDPNLEFLKKPYRSDRLAKVLSAVIRQNGP